MDGISSICCESLKRSWRRRRCRRFQRGTNNKRNKLKIIRLGGGAATHQRFWKLRTKTPKLHWEKLLELPIRFLVNFHDAYVNMMIKAANSMGNMGRKGMFGGKKVAKEKHISMVSCGEELLVDTRFVLEIHKRLAASPELSNN